MNHWTTPIRHAARSVMAIAAAAAGMLGAAQAAVPGITGPTFNLNAGADQTSQPDGAMIYTWGYGCDGAPAGFKPAALTISAGPAPVCPAMQLPGPTLIVTEGQTVTVNLTNRLPGVAGKTSIVFPGQTLISATGGTPGLLAQEAGASDCGTGCNTVSYKFKASKPGTYAYHSGSRPEVQVEMGMYGALIVLPETPAATCPAKGDYSHAASAYDHAATCYDREYLFQFSEFSSVIHDQVKAQVEACPASTCPLNVTTEPYRANYYMVNGRSMPDLMDTAYSTAYERQPYNGNPHMHPGETVLMRNIGHGRWQHPFHFHGNHARVIARDGNLLLSASDTSKLAGPLLFTLPTLPGQTVDMLFGWTGQGLNWDMYGDQAHTCNGVDIAMAIAAQAAPAANGATLALLKANGGFDPTTKEYCPDHGKPMPVTPPDPSIVANGQWYGGTPYLGLSNFDPTKLAPGTLNQNPSAGYAYMWHSHNEREITTNDVFPGGILMMLIIDPTAWIIDETL
jgi:FtsP/CotA-like multicopper oxidase with cupredoxin domain